MNHESVTPIQSFEVAGKRYTLTHSAGSDAAFDSLREGIDYHERERILSKVRHLEQSDAPPQFVSNTSVQLQEEYVKANGDLWRVDQLLQFARTHQGLPYLLVVASPEIGSFEQAKEVVGKLDALEIGEVVQKCMIAAGVLKEKNLSGPRTKKKLRRASNQRRFRVVHRLNVKGLVIRRDLSNGPRSKTAIRWHEVQRTEGTRTG